MQPYRRLDKGSRQKIESVEMTRHIKWGGGYISNASLARLWVFQRVAEVSAALVTLLHVSHIDSHQPSCCTCFQPRRTECHSHDESKIILCRLLMPLLLQAARIIGPLGLISLQDYVETWVDLLSPLKLT